MMSRYLKRFRMEIDVQHTPLPRAVLPETYRWGAWSPRLLGRHAATKHASFHGQLDCQLFPALGTFTGCLDLMRGISRHSGFLPQATWLVECDEIHEATGFPCGTIQGIAHNTTLGSIQNIGVLPEHRGLGLGRALILKALRGFRSHGLIRVYLDVTADNVAAVKLYHSLGFQRVKTGYREIPRTCELVRQ